MSRGTAVREFVGKLRSAFFDELGMNGRKDGDNEFFDYTIRHAFERAVNDTLLGQNTETKPVPRPRKKRGPNKPRPATPQPEVNDEHL